MPSRNNISITFVILALLFFNSNLLAQNTIVMGADSFEVMAKVNLIKERFKKQKWQSFRKFKPEIDSLHYFVSVGLDKNKVGNFQVARRQGRKQNERIEYTFFDGKLARILIMKFKVGFISQEEGGAVYFFDHDKLIYNSRNIAEFPNVDELITLSYTYLHKIEEFIAD